MEILTTTETMVKLVKTHYLVKMQTMRNRYQMIPEQISDDTGTDIR